MKNLAALAGVVLGLGAGAGTALAAPENTQPSVWEHHQATTAWFGQTAHYTCLGLENTLRHILLYLGARPDLKVEASCPNLVDPLRSAVVKTDFYTLKPASSETGDTISAQWVPVKVTPNSPWQAPFVGTSECELLFQFKDLFSKSFSFQKLNYTANCFPHSVTLLDYYINGQVLKTEAQLKAVAQR
jgi:hypothetical protein